MTEAPRYASNRREGCSTFFSLCIPQYNRTDFLIKALSTFEAQTFRDFEVCISDDCSTDGRTEDLLRHLRSSGLTYVYFRSSENLRYDCNLRRAIDLSTGRYVWLMGNDDGLSSPDALAVVRDELIRHAPVAVAITNYREALTGHVYRRMNTTGVLGAGLAAAVGSFRRYSFVSGVVFDGPAARREASPRCDGSEMYQMYLGTRLVGAGGSLLSVDRVCVDKDLQVPCQSVDTYRRLPKAPPWPVVERPLPMGRLLEIVAAGLEQYHSGRERERNLVSVAMQLYTFIYPFWGVEYRRVQSWSYALGVLIAVRPSRIARGLGLSFVAMLRLWSRFLLCGAVALVTPIGVFDAVRDPLYAIAKKFS
jgi:Glycosyl transferase family 2